jgi:hypothetical protein
MRSQGSLAKLRMPSRGITPFSLNTFKRLSDEQIDGGFETIDGLRKIVRSILASETTATGLKSKSNVRTHLKVRVDELGDNVTRLEESLHHLTRAYWAAIQLARECAERSGSVDIVSYARRREQEIRAMASLMPRPL